MTGEKIAILSAHIPPHYSGAGKRALNQAKYLGNRGFEVVFITTTPSNLQLPGLELVSIAVPTVYETDTLAGAICRQAYHHIFFIKLLTVLLRKKIKLLHCIPAFSWFAFAAVLAARILGIKIITETTLYGTDDPLTIRNKKVGRLKFLIFRLSDVIVNISPLLVSKCKEAGISEQKLLLIPNSVDTDRFVPPDADEKEALKCRLGLRGFKNVYIYVGIMRARKRVALLIDAFKQVSSLINDCCLVLAGPINKDRDNKEYYRELEFQVDREGLSDRIVFTGKVDNIEEWMKASDLFLFASSREGFGTVMVEAMSTGLPVVAMRIPGITDYIITDDSGTIADDLDQFCKRVVALTKDRDHYNKLSSNARKRALRYFSDETVMSKYTELYKTLLNDKEAIC